TRIPARTLRPSSATGRTLRAATHRGAVGDGVSRRAGAAHRGPSGFGAALPERALRPGRPLVLPALSGRATAAARGRDGRAGQRPAPGAAHAGPCLRRNARARALPGPDRD